LPALGLLFYPFLSTVLHFLYLLYFLHLTHANAFPALHPNLLLLSDL
jgi:hypothetical protein